MFSEQRVCCLLVGRHSVVLVKFEMRSAICEGGTWRRRAVLASLPRRSMINTSEHFMSCDSLNSSVI